MKYIIILILINLVISCENKNPNEFTLHVKVNGDYKDYLYLNYDNMKDSSLVKNGSAFFKGTVSIPTSAYYTTNNTSASDKNFYIENEKINTEITLSKRKIGEYTLDWFTINKISGTKTSIIRKDFENFKSKFSSEDNWQYLLFEKLNKIIEQNPQHIYSGDLLSEISNETILNNEQIGKLYHLLQIELQNPQAIKKIAYKAFPQYKIESGDLMFDFDLPNRENNLISTDKFRGKILFIDFWASWCKPCRTQFPKLTKLNNEYKEKGITILGVSLDENKEEWVKAMETENPKWENVIDNAGFQGEIANNYGIFAIPYNVLADEKGKVIAVNISVEQFGGVLDSLIVNKKLLQTSERK